MSLIRVEFPRFFSTDSAKAEKAESFGYLNGINYMSPSKSGGVILKSGRIADLCTDASPECIALCLGLESGQAAMVPVGGTNTVRESRKRKAAYFMHRRREFLLEAMLHIAKLVALAAKLGVKLCVRMNGSTDIAFEGSYTMVTADHAALLSRESGLVVTAGPHSVYTAFPSVQFVDYTKNYRRFD